MRGGRLNLVVGGAMIVGGSLTVFGSLTGRLPAILAAIFKPKDLVSAYSITPVGTDGGIGKNVTDAIIDVITTPPKGKAPKGTPTTKGGKSGANLDPSTGRAPKLAPPPTLRQSVGTLPPIKGSFNR